MGHVYLSKSKSCEIDISDALERILKVEGVNVLDYGSPGSSDVNIKNSDAVLMLIPNPNLTDWDRDTVMKDETEELCCDVGKGLYTEYEVAKKNKVPVYLLLYDSNEVFMMFRPIGSEVFDKNWKTDYAELSAVLNTECVFLDDYISERPEVKAKKEKEFNDIISFLDKDEYAVKSDNLYSEPIIGGRGILNAVVPKPKLLLCASWLKRKKLK